MIPSRYLISHHLITFYYVQIYILPYLYPLSDIPNLIYLLQNIVLMKSAFTRITSHYSTAILVLIFFFMEYIAELSEHIGINDHAIKLEKEKQLLFGPIYSLGPIELEIWKTYIKTNLANNFIRLFKYPVKLPILFDQKPNKSLCLCIDYWDLNNVTMKNQYLLLLIDELLDKLGQTKQFT